MAHPHYKTECCRTIKQIVSDKAPDAFPAEIFKLECPQMLKKLTDLFVGMLSQGCIPQKLKSNIIHLYSRKGNYQSFDYH